MINIYICVSYLVVTYICTAYLADDKRKNATCVPVDVNSTVNQEPTEESQQNTQTTKDGSSISKGKRSKLTSKNSRKSTKTSKLHYCMLPLLEFVNIT